MLEKKLKITRSEYLKGKTALTDEDIIRILDLPPEKESRTDIKSYTDKEFTDYENDSEPLSQLTEELKNDSEYFLYRDSYIAKSKLLYEESLKLYNEIPCLLIGEEIREQFYLLPYGYAMDKNLKFRKFADALNKNIFTDFKRIYGNRINKTFSKSKKQGKNAFFIISSKEYTLEKARGNLSYLINDSAKRGTAEGRYYLYDEKSNKIIVIDADKNGLFTEEKSYDLKKLRSVIPNRPFYAQGRTESVPTSTNLTLNVFDNSVNEFFNSMLLRGAIEIYKVRTDFDDYREKYLENIKILEEISSQIKTDFFKSSNLSFIQKEKNSQYYKDLIRQKERNVALMDKPQGERTMEKENREESYFNKILEKLKNNELDNNYIIDLGKPGAILKECGFPDKKIEMNAGRLLMKAQLSRHPFELEDIKDFDKSLQEPVAVFSYGSENYGRDVIVNLKKDDKNFLAGISFNTDNEQLKVSSVRTIFPKDNIEWLNWINQGKLIYCDKKEIQALSAQLQMNFADVSNQDNRTSSVTYCLDSLDSILDKFENSKQIYTKKYPFYEEIRAKNEIIEKFTSFYVNKNIFNPHETAEIEGTEFFNAIKEKNEEKIKEYTSFDNLHDSSKLARTILAEKTGYENILKQKELNNAILRLQNSINYHGLTLTKKDNNLIEPAYEVLLIAGIDDKTDSKLIEMLDNTAKWDQFCVLNKSENYIPAIAAEIVSKEKEVKNENVNKSFIEKVQDLKAKVSKSLKKNVAVGVALTSILSANPNLFAQEKPVKLPSEQTILKEAAKEKENLLKTYKDKSPEELLKLLLEANEEKTAAKIQASNLEKSVKELEVRNTKLEFYKEHYKTKSATQENFYDEMKKTQDMYESLKRSSQEDHDILYKHAKIVVNGQERVCHTGLVDGFKNCVTRLDKSLKLNKELVKENKELRKIINQSNQNERNGVSY